MNSERVENTAVGTRISRFNNRPVSCPVVYAACGGLLSIARCLIPAVLLISPVAPAQSQSGDIEELDRVVAVVNDDVVVLSDLQERAHRVAEQLRQSGTAPPPDDVLERQVLERIIVDRLQAQTAEQAGIRVDDATLDRALSEMARKNGVGLGEFKRILERDGFVYATFRDDIREEIMISRLRRRQVENRIKVSDREIDNFLSNQAGGANAENEYRLSHILISVPEAASPEEIAAAKARGQTLLEKLAAGQDFAELAAAMSDGQQALRGGDLGWRKATQLPSLFSSLVPDLKEGEISGLIRSPSGFHVIRISGIRGEKSRLITQSHARHILIRTDEVTIDEDAETRLNQLKTRIEGGDDFEALAKSHSSDRGSAAKGGDLGWVSPGDLVPKFEQRMSALSPGEVSEPFKTQFGWHIVQLLERREHDNTEKVRRARARNQIRARKIEEETQAWLRRIRDEAYVEYRLDE